MYKIFHEVAIHFAMDETKLTYQTKVFGPLKLAQGFIPSMRKRGTGLLTATGSMFSVMPIASLGIGVYISALIAFERIQDALAIELRPYNINVVNFHPGPISTSLTRFEGSKENLLKTYYQHYTEHAYEWYAKHTEFQTAAEVAVAYADMIEAKNPDFHTYSSEAAKKFASQYLSDTSGNSYRDGLLAHFTNLEGYEAGDWRIE